MENGDILNYYSVGRPAPFFSWVCFVLVEVGNKNIAVKFTKIQQQQKLYTGKYKLLRDTKCFEKYTNELLW